MSKVKPSPLLPDTVIGGYRVVRRLSAGGFGVVYLAVDHSGQQVAIKEYLPSSLATRGTGELAPQVSPEKLSLYRLGPEELLRGRPLARADLACLGGERAQFLPRERDRLHGDELPGGRHPAGLHRHRARPEEAESIPRVDHPLAVRRDPARPAHRAPAQDAAPGHQAGQHLRDRRRPRRDDRLRRRARSAVQGRQLHPPDVHARLRRARDVPARFVDGPVDRHLRHRRLHLRLHAGLPAQRRAAAHREGPPRPVAVAPARHLFRQPDRSGRVVHVARPAVAPAVGVRAAEGAQPRRRAPLHQAHGRREGAAVDRQHALLRKEGPAQGAPHRPHARHEILRLPGQPQGRPPQERRPHGLLLHARIGPVRAGRRHGRPSRRRGGGAAGAADHRGALPARGAAGRQGRQGLPDRVGDGGAPADHALRGQQGHARHAAHHASWRPSCRAPPPPGSIAAIRACTWCATASC